MLKMPVSWFDIPRNNAGNLSSRLSIDCQLVNAITTTIFSIEIQNLATLLTGFIIAFVHEWRTALVALGLLPLIILVGATKMAINTKFGNKKNAV
jgi:ATP-binding cassette subfamily B (MDR/TAP) protein 1